MRLPRIPGRGCKRPAATAASPSAARHSHARDQERAAVSHPRPATVEATIHSRLPRQASARQASARQARGQAGTQPYQAHRPPKHVASPATTPCYLHSSPPPSSQPRPRPHALGTEIAGNYLTVSPRTAHRSPASIGIRSRARERLRAKSPAHLPPHPLLPRLHLHRDPAHDRPRPPTEFASCNFRSQPLARMPLNLARCLRRSAVPVLVGSNQKESQAQFELRGILPHNITTAVTVHARAGSFVFCSRRLAK